MNRRYKVISLLLLAALTVASVYGALTFQFQKTIPAEVVVEPDPYAFILSTDELVTNEIGTIQFSSGTQDESPSTSTIYYLVWLADPAPTGYVDLSFTATVENPPGTFTTMLVAELITGKISVDGSLEPWPAAGMTVALNPLNGGVPMQWTLNTAGLVPGSYSFDITVKVEADVT